MVYNLEFCIDGGCRGNGQRWAIGAAAACFWSSYYRRWLTRSELLDTSRFPATSQRAEITAIIIALEWALEKLDHMNTSADVFVTIYSDSAYAVGCMRDWIFTWVENGWVNARGQFVANQDLLRQASDLDYQVKQVAFVNYVRIPREQNQLADDACNEILDAQHY